MSVREYVSPSTHNRKAFTAVSDAILREPVTDEGMRTVTRLLDANLAAIRACVHAREMDLRLRLHVYRKDAAYADFEDLMRIWHEVDSDLATHRAELHDIDIKPYQNVGCPQSIAAIIDDGIRRVACAIEVSICTLHCVQFAVVFDDARTDLHKKCGAFIAHLRSSREAIANSVEAYNAQRAKTSSI